VPLAVQLPTLLPEMVTPRMAIDVLLTVKAWAPGAADTVTVLLPAPP
jgi:hypothetical protein